MAKHPAISEAEWEVMGVVWDARQPIGAVEVVDRVAGRMGWNPKTVKTLLGRLVKKGALGYEVEGKRYLYRPKVSREECVRREGRSFLKRVFAGQAGEMLCRFVDEVELSKDEIARLRRILEQKAK